MPENDEKDKKDEKKEIELEVVKEEEKEVPSTEEDIDRDALLAEEMTLLMNEFQTEIVEGIISRIRVYLAISEQLNFIVGIDFSNFPIKPLLTVQDELKSLINPEDLDSMKSRIDTLIDQNKTVAQGILLLESILKPKESKYEEYHY